MKISPSRIHAVMRGEDSSPTARALRGVTALAEPFFGGAVLLRDQGYRRGWLKRRELPAPTVSVGNLTTGGTGKTPVVRWLAERLIKAGRRPAVLMRGYHADAAGVSDEQQLLESVLSTSTAPIPVIANPDRVRGARQAIEQSPDTNVFLLDDGFQHRRVCRDFDLVLISATDPFGFNHLLPRGLLRERPTALDRADAVLITRSSKVDASVLNQLEKSVRTLHPSIPVFRSDHVQVSVRDGLSRERNDLSSLADQRLFAFCGIGSPKAFEEDLAASGLSLVGIRAFADHHLYSEADVHLLTAQARAAGATRLVTTEKDWMKLARLPASRLNGVPIAVVEMEIRFTLNDGERLLERVMGAIARRDKKGRTEEG